MLDFNKIFLRSTLFLLSLTSLSLPISAFGQDTLLPKSLPNQGSSAPNETMINEYVVSVQTHGHSVPVEYDALIEEGAQAYNVEEYQTAVQKFIKAVQLAPWLPVAYKNLARSYFYLSHFDIAAYYYNIYLNSPLLDHTKADSSDTEAVKEEFRTARANIKGGIVPPEDPLRMHYEKQYKAFVNSLDIDAGISDKSMTKPWGAYQALLRANIATPELNVIRNKLSNALASYIYNKLRPPVGYPTPKLRMEELRVLTERLFELRSACIDAKQLKWTENKQQLLSAIVAVASHNSTLAYSYIDAAIENNPTLPYVAWYKVALLFDDAQYQQAIQLLDSVLIARSLKEQKIPKQYVDLFRSAIEHAQRKNGGAAKLYWDIIQ